MIATMSPQNFHLSPIYPISAISVATTKYVNSLASRFKRFYDAVKLKQRQRYSAYGVTTREKNTDQLDKLIAHSYGFTGRELDSETGLYFYRSRYYSPEMQRFASEDPIGFLGGDANIYRYVFSNPLAYIDPFGLDTCGTGWSFNFSVFAHTFTIGRQKVLDNLGNRDTQWTLGLGASVPTWTW